jgi:hypothetical protein
MPPPVYDCRKNEVARLLEAAASTTGLKERRAGIAVICGDRVRSTHPGGIKQGKSTRGDVR